MNQSHANCEGVNTPFRFAIDCVSASAFLDVTAPIGQPMHLDVVTANGTRRHWHGYATSMAAVGADGGLARYHLVMESSLAFLAQRRNTLIFQDKTALEVLDQVFADHPELAWRNEATAPLRRRPICTQYRETDLAFMQRLLGEEGLSWRFEHTQSAGDDGPGHTLVLFDTDTSRSLPAGRPATIRFHRVAAPATADGITRFAERHELTPDQVTTASWRPEQVQSLTGSAQAGAVEGAPALPGLDVFEADRAGRFDAADQARTWATHRLDGLRLRRRSFHGQSAVRTLEAGKTYTLLDHPDLTGQAFVPMRIEHVATNNLGADLAALHGASDPEDLGKGSYRNAFQAVPAGVPIAVPHRDKPTAPGCEVAQVTGVPGEALTGTRDHQVRVQFFWQRGTRPLPGGLTDTASKSHGHAPGDDTSGTWVRVAEASAGAHHGASFVPRIGDEVLVTFAHGDIDRPVVVGQLYNGTAAPVFAAGLDSGANHPGTLSGMQTQGLDGQPSATWVLDDASGQLRHGLSHTLADSQLNLGYLIDQSGAQRGGYRGEGFELITAGWAVLRAGEGMLLSATARARGQSTQMDAAETLGQLKAAKATAERLDRAASQAKAQGLDANPAHADFGQGVDPKQQGTYPGTVNGQAATRPTGGKRSGGDPVEHFARPAVLMESPESVALTSPKSIASFTGEHHHLTSQRDAQLTAGTTLAAAAGANAGLYAADGGMKLIANHGSVSIEAHDDAMQILADKDVTVTSTADTIKVLAKQKIVLQAGQSTITLDGQNLTIACPGTFTVKTAKHEWSGGASQAATLESLPNSLTKPSEKDDMHNQQMRLVAEDGETPLKGCKYLVTASNGQKWSGTTDKNGLTDRFFTEKEESLILEILSMEGQEDGRQIIY